MKWWLLTAALLLTSCAARVPSQVAYGAAAQDDAATAERECAVDPGGRDFCVLLVSRALARRSGRAVGSLEAAGYGPRIRRSCAGAPAGCEERLWRLAREAEL